MSADVEAARAAARAQREGHITGSNLRETVAVLLDRVADEMDRVEQDGEAKRDLAVAIGQVWADNDKRSAGRQVRIVEVDATHATVELVDRRGRPALGHEAQQKAEPGRRTRIRLDRFRPTATGYRLVSEADGTEATR